MRNYIIWWWAGARGFWFAQNVDKDVQRYTLESAEEARRAKENIEIEELVRDEEDQDRLIWWFDQHLGWGFKKDERGFVQLFTLLQAQNIAVNMRHYRIEKVSQF